MAEAALAGMVLCRLAGGLAVCGQSHLAPTAVWLGDHILCKQDGFQSSNSEISTDARAGGNAVPYTVALYAFWGICSITQKKKSVAGCSIPNRFSLAAT
jgi:hypothetical protein